jgi:Zn-finger nucleic acid-binding protein
MVVMSDAYRRPSQRVEEAPAERRRGGCPRCESPLVYVRYADLVVQECASCHGQLLAAPAVAVLLGDPQRVTAALAAIPAVPRQAETAVRYLHCPTCDALMSRNVFARVSGVIIDVCRKHGTFFDAGELPAALAFLANGGMERLRARTELEHREAARAHRVEETRRSLAPMSQSGAISRGRSLSGDEDVGDAIGALLSLFR